MALILTLKAFKLNQNTKNDKDIFNTTVSVRLLLDPTYFRINWWEVQKKNTKEQGYQRIPDETRKKKINQYLQSAINPVMPTNIVVSSRKKLDFKPIEGNWGNLTINSYPLWIIDGQNRIEGFRYAVNDLGNKDLLDYEMPVTIMSNLQIIDETEQFMILNVTQKKVKTDLAQVLKKTLMTEVGSQRYVDVYGDPWDLKALTVTEKLNSKNSGDLSNVWFGRIQEPNTKKAYSHIVSQNSFITSLRPLYKGGVFENDFTADEAYSALKNYWDAIEDIFPDAFLKPKDYVVQKTAGVFSLNDLANRIFQMLLKEKKGFDKASIKEKLHLAFPDPSVYNQDYWMANNYFGAARAGSMKGFKSLAEEFKNNLVKGASNKP